MTDIQPLVLTPERIQFIKKSVSKKHVFDSLKTLLADGQSEVTANMIFDALISREKLGNTSIGNETSVPRAHLDIINPRAALLILKNPLKSTDTVDKKGIRYFLALIIPENQKEKYSEVVIKINQELAKDKILDTLASAKNPELLSDYINSLFVIKPINVSKK